MDMYTDLDRKAHKLECFILAPAANDVWEWAVWVFIQWRLMCGASPLQCSHSHRNEQCKDTIHKHQKLRVGKTLARCLCLTVIVRHNTLLQQTPDEIRCQQTTGTKAEKQSLLGKWALMSSYHVSSATRVYCSRVWKWRRSSLDKHADNLGHTTTIWQQKHTFLCVNYSKQEGKNKWSPYSDIRLHHCCVWIIQLYSPGGVNVHLHLIHGSLCHKKPSHNWFSYFFSTHRCPQTQFTEMQCV